LFAPEEFDDNPDIEVQVVGCSMLNRDSTAAVQRALQLAVEWGLSFALLCVRSRGNPIAAAEAAALR